MFRPELLLLLACGRTPSAPPAAPVDDMLITELVSDEMIGEEAYDDGVYVQTRRATLRVIVPADQRAVPLELSYHAGEQAFEAGSPGGRLCLRRKAWAGKQTKLWLADVEVVDCP